jgi:hypothetical protein
VTFSDELIFEFITTASECPLIAHQMDVPLPVYFPRPFWVRMLLIVTILIVIASIGKQVPTKKDILGAAFADPQPICGRPLNEESPTPAASNQRIFRKS